MESGPDYHHVILSVSRVTPMPIARNPQQNIKAIVHVKMNKAQAEGLRDILQRYLGNHREGMDMVTFSLEGDFS